MTYTAAHRYASQCQIEADQTAWLLLHERRYWLLQEYCSFNVRGIMLLGWYRDFMDFVILHGSELRRPFTLDEFLHHAGRYRIILLRHDPKSFAEMKKIKIKRHNPLP